MSKDELIIREEEYEGLAEETQMNIPFEHEKLEAHLRENFDDFFMGNQPLRRNDQMLGTIGQIDIRYGDTFETAIRNNFV